MRFAPITPSHPLTVPPPASDRPSVMAFSLAKAGSTLLYDMLAALAPHAGLAFYSAEDQLFAANVSPNRRPTRIGRVFAPNGYLYGGFRQFPAYRIPVLHSAKSIFLVRDPRDMAVSLYFSQLKSHILPDGEENDGARAAMLVERERLAGIGIDRWVTGAAITQYKRMFEGYIAQGFLWRNNVATYRYEDVVFGKRAWLRDMCEWFDWDISHDITDRIADRFDIVPKTEQPDQHIRQVIPGNYKAHLSAASIEALGGAFGEYLKIYGYEV